MIEQALRSRELMEKISRIEQERVTYTRELLDRQVRVGDTYTAARLVVSAVELVVHQLIAAPDPIDTNRLENERVAMITRYLTAVPA